MIFEQNNNNNNCNKIKANGKSEKSLGARQVIYCATKIHSWIFRMNWLTFKCPFLSKMKAMFQLQHRTKALLFLEHSIWRGEEGEEGAKSCCQLESKLMFHQRAGDTKWTLKKKKELNFSKFISWNFFCFFSPGRKLWFFFNISNVCTASVGPCWQDKPPRGNSRLRLWTTHQSR